MTPGEIRVDPLTGLRVIVAPERAGRPGALAAVAPAAPIDPAVDPFAPGHESETPPTLAAHGPETGGWTARAFANRYPALVGDPPHPAPEAKPDLFGAVPALGAHEVIVNAPESVASLADLQTSQVVDAVELWRERMRAHAAAAYVHVHVNERPEAGASLAHSHAQLYALDFVPALVARERERFGAHAVRTMGGNLLADLVQEEVRRRDRIVAIDDEAVLMVPWAARAPYALLLAPRRTRGAFEEAGPTGAALLHDGLRRLARRFGASPPLNLWIRTAPRGAEQFCWHIDVLPRLAVQAGLELGTGVELNVVSPEQAADELRNA
jgi:UDPglucose--hexose-1-phosphate uridylyltransferase